MQLGIDLQEYQNQLVKLGIKDDRIRKPLPTLTILYRLLIRLTWSIFLLTISIPGLLLWIPVFITTFIAVHKFKQTGPVWDTYDEIAQYKLVYGLASGVLVWFASMMFTLPIAPLTAILVPAAMWMSLRWLEDAVSAFRAFTALTRLLLVGPSRLEAMRKTREELLGRVLELAVNTLGLPEAPERHFKEAGDSWQKGRVRGRWASKAKYFSVRGGERGIGMRLLGCMIKWTIQKMNFERGDLWLFNVQGKFIKREISLKPYLIH
ncbi:hypothetical protein QCA50_004228 [Cerrena zonata]|uniref:Uncharacterized protein n=1 Tax=Cerrena zonata TaxID=2478898 RepID=A0AAW0GSS1_9APHY